MIIDQRVREAGFAEYDAAKTVDGDRIDNVELFSTMQAARCFI
jgi:hypothetical protein